MKFRDQGAIGALLDEYERALNDLIAVIADVSRQDLEYIVDPLTQDPDCRSIQSVLTHVVQSGYTYVVEIRRWLEEDQAYFDKVLHTDVGAYSHALEQMFSYTEELFEDYPKLKLCCAEQAGKIHTRWGQSYDVEQLFEHAIVHILRHRRQIERFILKLNKIQNE